MPNPGRIYQVVERHRRDLLRHERAASSAMVREYGIAWQRVKTQLDALTKSIEAARKAGEEVTPSWLFERNRLQSLLAQVETEISRFVDYAEPEIARQQRDAIDAAQRHVREQIETLTDDATILAEFNRLHVGAVEDLIGFTEKGPLRKLLDELGPQVSRGFRETMVESLVVGRNPRETARRIRKEFSTGLARTLKISRTETLRVYREATRRNYQENENIISGWMWLSAKQARTCVACLAMDGTIHPLSERLNDHPNGRCTSIAVPKNAKLPPRETGAEWFDKQDEETQRKILGSAGYEAYKAKAVTLDDFVGLRESRDWGTTRYARSLRSIVGADEAKKWGEKATNTVASPPPDVVLSPAGDKISSIFDLPGERAKLGQISRETLSAVESVHGIPAGLPRIAIKTSSSTRQAGGYEYYLHNDMPAGIKISNNAPRPHLTTAHEIGHFMDHKVVGSPRTRGHATDLNSQELAEWRDAVSNSKSHRALQDMYRTGKGMTIRNGQEIDVSVDRKYVRYLMEQGELFARSYAQYIAEESGDPTMLSDLAEAMRGERTYKESQWESEDFKPIRNAFNNIFKGMGLRK